MQLIETYNKVIAKLASILTAALKRIGQHRVFYDKFDEGHLLIRASLEEDDEASVV